MLVLGALTGRTSIQLQGLALASAHLAGTITLHSMTEVIGYCLETVPKYPSLMIPNSLGHGLKGVDVRLDDGSKGSRVGWRK